ncbi:glycosyltransferase family 2 protein [Pseudobutyrivibrio sp. MD2005]|uniref:glycosyltransferase family 2 protein n=1 Tax=Pseudobutyrivibrio sp. MD2005 TaxID=1410616 RepID=UPI0004878B84|nr:glycosyltransferase family 2 protein [Pseudobutyrivibrio sp. MD2005]
MEKKLLSIVVPAYNEQESLPLFYNAIIEIEQKLNNVDIELLIIDDGSKDNTLSVIKELKKKDSRVHYVSFSRNFGKEAGIFAGLKHSKGDYVVMMDADLQDPPALLPEMLKYLESGEYQCVATRRVDRKGEPPIRSWFARKFYRLMNKISDADIVDGARDYQMMTRKVVEAILSMGEYNRFSKGIFGWVGFKRKWLEFENTERIAGETKWSFWKLFIYAIDGIVAFSTAPLTMVSLLGLIMCMVAFLFIIVIIIRTLVFGDPTNGWPSMVCIILLVSGIQLSCLGIIGQYMAKTYLETKHRPIYIIGETDEEQE